MLSTDSLIDALELKPHPEGGFYRQTYKSEEVITGIPERYQGQSRNISTAIYYLLKGDQFSAFHKIKSDEIWHFYKGSPLKLFVIDKTGAINTHLLGNDINKGEHFQVVIRQNQWFAAKPLDPDGFTLAGCTVAPGFDFSDFKMATQKELLNLYPEHHSLIKEFSRK